MAIDTSRITQPRNIDEANERIDVLKADITSIQDQLRKRKSPRKGSSADDVKSFHTWRHRAVDSMRWKQAELPTLKIWKREFYRGRGRKLCETMSVTGLLYRVYRANKRLLALEGATLTEEEQGSMDDVQSYLRSVDTEELGNLNDSNDGNKAEENKAGS